MAAPKDDTVQEETSAETASEAQEVNADKAEASQEASAKPQGSESASASSAADATESQENTTSDSHNSVAQAQEEASEWRDKYYRLHAEWDTYRRRMNEQREEEKLRATEKLVEELIPILDDFERTIDYAEKNGETGLLGGVTAVHNKLKGVFEKEGVEVIDPKGEAFDALEAQAVGTVDDASVPDETVAEVYQKGYRMGNKVIRSAMVTVTVGGPKRETEEESSE